MTINYQFDELGRNTEVLRPAHDALIDGVNVAGVRTAQWTVYRDDIDQVWRGQGYVVGEETTLINPVSISISNAGGQGTKSVSAISSVTDERLSADMEFPESSWVRLSETFYNDGGEMIASRVYHAFGPAWSSLTLAEWDELTLDQWDTMELNTSDNYAETTFGYDAMGRRNRVVSPGGTITRSVFDVRGQAVSSWIGTDDTGATDDNPDGSGGPNNMVMVAANEYDDGEDSGDGELTKTTRPVDDEPEHDRITAYLYDWRGRQTTVNGQESFVQFATYDNLDQIIKTQRFDPRDSDKLLSQIETFYDNRGRVFRTKRWGVEDGTPTQALESNTWYDASGNTLKSQPAGSQAWTKNVYDGLGRTTSSYVGYSTEPEDYEEAGTIETSVVFQQSDMTYDNAGSLIATVGYERFHNADSADLGRLNPPGGSDPQGRASLSAAWYDGIGRTIFSGSYGTNSLTRDDEPPASANDAALVTQTVFNDEGMAYQTIDPMGRIDETVFDKAGRRVLLIENKSDGEGFDKNRTTGWLYNADGRVIDLTAINSVTGDQHTRYAYGVELGDSWLASNDLLHTETYPDGGVVTHDYNIQGERIKTTDQNETVHEYSYDLLGRQTLDAVTAVGGGIDDAVLAIATAYNVRGLVEKITSYDGPDPTMDTVVNQVQREYNAFDQLKKEYQEHDGEVDTGTTPNVQYDYEDGSANTIRATSLTYPNGRVLEYDYGVSDGDNDKLSRIEQLVFDSVAVANYKYLGLGAVVVLTYAECSPEVKYDMAMGGGADPYTGLDAVGRIIDCRWHDGTDDLERLKYGYDLASNRLWRQNDVARALDKDFDELYSYDGLYQLNELQRGRLNSGHTALEGGSLAFKEDWTLDPTGNWKAYQQNEDGTAVSLDQTRTANPVNEITGITNTVGAAWAQPAYDAAGNMTTMPQPANPTASYQATFDAWNRLVKLEDGENTVAEYAYDGRTFRTVAKNYEEHELSETRHFYFDAGWRSLEERLGDTPSSSDADRQYVWGLRYIDDLVLRDRTVTDPLDERLYATQDANWNATCICDTGGAVQERFIYSSYGVPSALSSGFTVASIGFSWDRCFAGYYFDQSTSLMHVRIRYYHSVLGRWITRDPYKPRSRVARAYEYVRSQPISFVDPLGLTEYDDCMKRSSYYCAAAHENPKNSWLLCACSVSYLICLAAVSHTVFPGTKTAKKGGWLYCINKCIFLKWLSAYEDMYPDSKLSEKSGIKGDLKKVTKEWQDAIDCVQKGTNDGSAKCDCCRSHVIAEQSALQACMTECGTWDTDWGNPFDYYADEKVKRIYGFLTLGGDSPEDFAELLKQMHWIGVELLPFKGDFNKLQDRIDYGYLACACNTPLKGKKDCSKKDNSND